ncbi:MAG: sulfatase [Lentisphaeria bacterium]|nr:sulfatase [Lentisphaeria bacterium]
MRRRDFLRFSALACGAAWGWRGLAAESVAARPNLLLITADDLNCDSLSCFGCGIAGISPHLDALAEEGIRFEYAHVQVANCMPSRNVLHSGRYPHANGVEGFYQVRTEAPVLPGVLKEHGYLTAVKNKVGHSTPYSPFPWDIVEERTPEARGSSRSPRALGAFTARVIAAAKDAGKPFYLNLNITDPHKPFHGEPASKEAGFDDFPPSRTFRAEEVPVPGFLPEHPEVRDEVRQYFDSVRRVDDSVGAVLAALKASGAEAETVVMFLSDHGMPFPFAKTNLYHHSTRTPWIVRWPGHIRPGNVDRRHMISAVDYTPTALELAGIPLPDGLHGRSFLPLLLGQSQENRDQVIKEYNENSGGARHPMRCVETQRFCYIFNPWSNGTRRFRTATQGTRTYKTMQKLAETDPVIAERVRLFDYRAVEELYDVTRDRDALHNLIDDPQFQAEAERLRRALEAWMVATRDPYLDAFRRRHDPKALDEAVNRQQAESDERRKAGRERQGRRAAPRTDLLRLESPKAVQRGEDVVITVAHTLPAELGPQRLHVTIKRADGPRIERQEMDVQGTGTVQVPFRIPNDPGIGTVVFAVFVGKDFPSNLQHIVSAPVQVR